MPAVMPETVKSDSNKLVVFVTTPPAASTGIPTVAEVNAAIFASLYIVGDFAVTPTQNTGAGPSKLGSSVTPTELGRTTYPAVDVQYTYVPQSLGTPGGAGNEVYEALVPGSQVTAVVLEGYDGQASEVAAGDVADIFLMEVGKRRKGRTGDGEFDEVSVTQSLVVVGGEPIVEDHALAAS
jgi:hypothetical protein